ncbi:MAG: YidC/Oxa1 family rane protein insertase [Dehalococcoidia bacterium]|nr:YidC/Oxa1 family rane protein insertase [Dehalococcoidia bacterium]
MGIVDIWNLLVIQPLLNGLILLYYVLFNNFGLTIIAFTISVRLVMLPMTLKQLHATKAMSQLQPKLTEIQRRYKDDRQRLGQEQMKLYREAGVNPLGCAVPTFLQFPIWIGLYQSILLAMAADPKNLLDLSQHLYSWLPQVHGLVPLKSGFLWLDLSAPDRTVILPMLVLASTWIQQKMMTMPSADPSQKRMNDMMQWMMPLMLGFFALQFASGLAIYWVVSNIATMVIQYFVSGWGGLKLGSLFGAAGSPASQPTQVDTEHTDGETEEELAAGKRQRDGRTRKRRKNSRRGSRTGAPGARP